MAKKTIPVYDICSLTSADVHPKDFLVERFSSYLARHYHHLHLPHRHSFYHLVIFTKGSGLHAIDFTSYPVNPGQFYGMIPGQVHRWKFDGAVDGYIVNFAPSFFQSFLSDPHYLERFDFFNGISDESVIQLSAKKSVAVLHQSENLLKYVNEKKEFETDVLRLMLLQLFFLLQPSDGPVHNKPVPRQKQLMLRSFRQLVEKHYRVLKMPKDYAEMLYITPNHLNAISTDLAGKNAGQVIRDRVLLEAKRLLTNAGMTISEIAYDLEFQDNSYFTRFFKKYTGQTPEAFRKSIYSSIL